MRQPALTFRIRVGDHRILYRIEHDHARILVITIDKRSRAYD